MSTKLLRECIRQILHEQENKSLPKGDWVLLTPEDPLRDDIKQDLYDMIQTTYSDIGGHFKISSPESLGSYEYWAVTDLDSDPEPDVALLAKPDIGGTKMGAAATDGSGPAASAYKNKSTELRKGGSLGGVSNWWGEVSDKAAYAMISRGAPAVEDEEKVRELLGGKNVVWHGEHPDPNAPDVFKRVRGWYTRDIGGHTATKVILGSPQ